MATEQEQYIASARDSIIAYCDRLGYVHCVTCCDKLNLTRDPSYRVYGDTYDTSGSRCDHCYIPLASLSESCQREHDEQQDRWSRLPVTHVVEMGMVSAIRCRVY